MKRKSIHGQVATATAAALGIVTGLRSQLPMAFLARTAEERLLAHPVARWGSTVGAASELVIDKLPVTPSRLNPGSLTGRTVLGAIGGAVIARRLSGSPAGGAVVGGAGAVAGSFAGYHLRQQIGRRTGLPDPLIALLEDSIALTAATLLVRVRK